LLVALVLVGGSGGETAGQTGSPRIDRVVIEGNSRVDEEAIRVHLRSTEGATLDRVIVARDVRTVYGMGFFDQVEADWQESDGGGVLVFRVVERPLIREVKIEGAKRVKAEEIEAALKVRKHTILDSVKVREGLAAAKKVYEEEGYLDAVIEHRAVDLGNNEVELVYTIDEKDLVRIKRIEFEGNEAFSDRRLRRVMATKKKGLFSRFTGSGVLKRDVLEIDRERIAAQYYEDGYITVRVDEPRVERRDDGLFVTVGVDEGPQYKIGGVSIVGVEKVVADPEKVIEELDLQPGGVFSASALRRDVETVTDVLADGGYAFANVEPQTQIRSEDLLVDVAFTAETGPQVYIDRIEVVGNVKTRDKVIRRELKVHERELFSGTKLRKSREALQRLGFFRSVDVKTRRAAAPDRLDVTVEVSEGQTGAFSAGAGFSSADRLLFNVRVSEINLFGRGQRIVLNADFGSLRRNFVLSFTEPYLFDTYLTLGLDAFSWRLEFEDFTREGTGLGARLLYPVTAFGWEELWGMSLEEVRIGMAYRLEQANITDLSSSATRSIRLEEGKSLISSITPRIRRNTLNHALDPTGGSLQDLSLEFAGLGGDANFVKGTIRSQWYYTFFESPTFGAFTYSLGATLGLGFGEDGENGDELPLFERYFPGGLNSVRGYKTRTLGPREQQRSPLGEVVDESEIGGSQELVVNNEIIFPIIKGLGMKGVVFLDAGNAFTASQGIDVTDLQYATGGAVRWLSPFGPLQMGMGFPLNPRPDDDKNVLLFSFGGPVQ
jgi:outer membrane protein insertion porin family